MDEIDSTPSDGNQVDASGSMQRYDKNTERMSVPAAIIGGVFNAGIIALIAAIPGFNLSFITAGFAAITLPLMAGPVASATSAFMRLGYVTPLVRNLAAMVERAAGAWGCWAMYTFYPLAFGSLGLPPMVDTVVKTAFGILAIINGLGFLRNFVRLFRGNQAPQNKRERRLHIRQEKNQRREQDSFFEDN